MGKPHLTRMLQQRLYESRKRGNIYRLSRRKNKQEAYYHELLKGLNIQEGDIAEHIKNYLMDSSPNFEIILNGNLRLASGLYYHGPNGNRKIVEISSHQSKDEQIKTLFHEMLHFHPGLKEINRLSLVNPKNDEIIELLAKKTYNKRVDLVKMAEARISKLELTTSL